MCRRDASRILCFPRFLHVVRSRGVCIRRERVACRTTSVLSTVATEIVVGVVDIQKIFYHFCRVTARRKGWLDRNYQAWGHWSLASTCWSAFLSSVSRELISFVQSATHSVSNFTMLWILKRLLTSGFSIVEGCQRQMCLVRYIMYLESVHLFVFCSVKECLEFLRKTVVPRQRAPPQMINVFERISLSDFYRTTMHYFLRPTTYP